MLTLLLLSFQQRLCWLCYFCLFSSVYAGFATFVFSAVFMLALLLCLFSRVYACFATFVFSAAFMLALLLLSFQQRLWWLCYFVFLAVFMLALPHSAMKLRRKGSGGYGVRPCHSQIKGPSCTLHALLNLEVSLRFDMVLQTLWGHDPTLRGCHARSRWPLAVSGPRQHTSWIRGGQLCSASVMGETPLVSFLCRSSASCSIMPNQNSYHKCLTRLGKTKWAFVRFIVRPSCPANRLGLSET